MPQWSDYSTGQRIKILRGKELRQHGLADATGLSLVTIQKAEQDKALSLSTLLKISGALGVDPSVILGHQPPRRSMAQGDRTMMRDLSRAVHDTRAGILPETVTATNAEDVEEGIGRCWGAYWTGAYTEAGALVTPLLTAAAAHLHDQPVGQQARAWGLLSDAYRLAAYVSNLMGSRDLAYASIGHAQDAAREAADDMRVALVESGRAWVYLRDARLHDALALAEKSAADIEPRFSRASLEELTVYGSHVNFAAVVASRLEDRDRAELHMSQSHAVGARMGSEHRAHGTLFGPTSATTQAVGIHVAMGSTGTALALIDSIRDVGELSEAAQNRYAMDKAMAMADAKMWDASLETLEETLIAAPVWARHQALPRVILERVGRASTARLRRVAQLVGAPAGETPGGFARADERSAL